MRTVTRTLIAVAGLGLATTALAGEDPSSYAKELAELRTEVARLSSELEARREDLRGRLRSLASQQADLEVQIRREEVRLGVLEDAAARQRELIASEGSESQALVPVVEESIELLRGSVRSSLPYRQDERLAALDKLSEQLSEGTLRPQAAASRLWQFAEDELRLTRENILDKQVITLGGEEVLFPVARVGMVALYYRTEDGRSGYAVRDGDGWTWRPLVDESEQAQVAVLFDNLERQIRTGWFEVPHLITEVSQ